MNLVETPHELRVAFRGPAWRAAGWACLSLCATGVLIVAESISSAVALVLFVASISGFVAGARILLRTEEYTFLRGDGLHYRCERQTLSGRRSMAGALDSSTRAEPMSGRSVALISANRRLVLQLPDRVRPLSGNEQQTLVAALNSFLVSDRLRAPTRTHEHLEAAESRRSRSAMQT